MYHNHVTVSIPFRKDMLGIERVHVTRLCYSVPRLQEPICPGCGGVHGMHGARGATGLFICEHGHTIIPKSRAVK